MKIYTVTEPTIPFVYYTTGMAIPSFAKQIEAECIQYSLSDFKRINVSQQDKDEAVWIVEAVYLRLSGLTPRSLKKLTPNAKIVTLGGDCIEYLDKCTSTPGCDQYNGFEFFGQREVDLHLDLLDEVVENYTNQGIKSDYWMWTISKNFIKQVVRNKPDIEKQRDVIFCVAPQWNKGYRQKLLDHLNSENITWTLGGNGHTDTNINGCLARYWACRISLGTTSPSWTRFRTMKGFRDWLAPFTNTILIYDNHPDVIKKYPVPIYDYHDFEDCSNLIKKIVSLSDQEKIEILEKQKDWAWTHSIENQLYHKLTEHGII